MAHAEISSSKAVRLSFIDEKLGALGRCRSDSVTE